MTKMLKKIFYRIALLIALLVLLNFIYTRWFLERDIQKHSDIINLVREVPNDADIIYIGESSNITYRGDDVDKRPISDFIGDFFPELNTYDITKPASHAGIYKVLLEKIPDENQVKTVIVTLNLRSFNAQWIYSNLETPLQKSLVLLNSYPPLVNRFLLSFKAYDIKSDNERTEQFKKKWKEDTFDLPFDFQFADVMEWDDWMAYHGKKDKNGKYDQGQTELACHFIKAYGFQLDTNNNPRMHDFDKIIALAKQRNWNLVFNLLAENTEKAEDLVGEDLLYMINDNVQKLEKHFSNRGAIVVNNIDIVEDEQFIDQNWTTEHYAEKGRRIIAKNVAESLKEWHGDYYVDVSHYVDYQTSFFNNCDEDVKWGQMNTIANDIAFSGDNSSKTGNGNDFSVTLEYPLKKIPDSLKNTVDVSFWLYQKTNDHDAKLVIEVNGNEISNSWNGFRLIDKTKKINKWTKYSHDFILSDSIKNADLIKVYVLNQSNNVVYIDDFRVEIK